MQWYGKNVSEGTCIDLKEDCEHYDFKSLNAFIDKHNWYATCEVADYYAVRSGRENAILDGQPEKAKKLRDGEVGRVWAFLQAYFYRFVVDAKIYEHMLNENYQKDKQE